MVVQTYNYFMKYPNDPPLVKLAVIGLCTLETIDLGCGTHLTYHYLISSFGNPTGLIPLTTSFRLKLSVTTITVLAVHMLYAIRVWKLLNQSRAFRCGAVCVITGAIGVATYTFIRMWSLHLFTDVLKSDLPVVIYLSFSYATFVDLCLTTCLCLHLRRNYSRFTETNHLISYLMQYVIASGMATSACSLVTLITYAVMPETMVYIGFEFLLARIYVNSYLAMLNTRKPHTRFDRMSGSVPMTPRYKGPFSVKVQSQPEVPGASASHIELGGLNNQTDKEHLGAVAKNSIPLVFSTNMA